MSLVTHQTAAYVNGNPDKVLEDFTGLVFSLGMADIPVGEQGRTMLVSDFLKKGWTDQKKNSMINCAPC